MTSAFAQCVSAVWVLVNVILDLCCVLSDVPLAVDVVL